MIYKAIQQKVLIGFFAILSIGLMAQQKQNCDFAQDKIQKNMCYERIFIDEFSQMVTYPQEAIDTWTEGRVIVRFSTNSEKEIENIQILGNPDKSLSKAVLKALYKLQESNDYDFVASNLSYRIPIDFMLED